MNSSTPRDVFAGDLKRPEVKSIYDVDGWSGLDSFSDSPFSSSIQGSCATFLYFTGKAS